MSTAVLAMASPNSLKRTYEEAELEPERSAYCSDHQQPAPTPPEPTTINLPLSIPHSSPSAGPPTVGGDICNTFGAPVDSAPKKTKLTFAEKESKRVEKEVKDRQKAEERAKKEDERLKREKERAEREEERLKKVEEKRVKDEEKRKAKEERDRLKEEEKAKKDEEKQKKEEEKNKKARSQLRLNAFFGQPSMPSRSSTDSPGPDGPDGTTSLNSRRSSIAEIEAMEPGRRSRSTSATPRKPKLSDFERAFPPFFVQSNTTLAPVNHFARDEEGLTYVRNKVDEDLGRTHCPGQNISKMDLDKLLYLAPHKRLRRYKPQPRVKDIIARIDGAEQQNPIDLTGSSTLPQKPSDLLRFVPMKFLKFKEDVRPPYIGTFTSIQDPALSAKIARNPFHKSLPEANYDYDSEAEWEDPGEGEDLDSEGEEELDEEDEGEMEGFLDDEEATDARVKRRPLLGDLEPTCTGLCWAEQDNGPDLSSYAIDMLTETPSFPIDPYSVSYWHQPTPTKPSTSIPPSQSTLMEPPRIPLHPINGANNLLTPSSHSVASTVKPTSSVAASTPANSKPPKRLIPSELVNDFKAAVEGSDLTKLGLVEQLKKKFPKQSKDVIRDSLDVVAERVGEKLAEQKWVLRQGV